MREREESVQKVLDIRAYWKARHAEMERQRKDEARKRRTRARELSKLIAALGMLGSEHAGERAAAALHVERLRIKLGKQWSELIR